MANVGEMVYFKTSKGRGRPYVGKIVRKMGIFTEIENKGQMIRVPAKLVGKDYTFKPYNTKAIKAAAETPAGEQAA